MFCLSCFEKIPDEACFDEHGVKVEFDILEAYRGVTRGEKGRVVIKARWKTSSPGL